MKQKIQKEHRLNDNCHLVDDTDLNNINNTFKLFKSEFERFKSELQSSREELKYSRDALNVKLNFILWFIGIGFAVLGVLIKMS